MRLYGFAIILMLIAAVVIAAIVGEHVGHAAQAFSVGLAAS